MVVGTLRVPSTFNLLHYIFRVFPVFRVFRDSEPTPRKALPHHTSTQFALQTLNINFTLTTCNRCVIIYYKHCSQTYNKPNIWNQTQPECRNIKNENTKNNSPSSNYTRKRTTSNQTKEQTPKRSKKKFCFNKNPDKPLQALDRQAFFNNTSGMRFNTKWY